MSFGFGLSVKMVARAFKDICWSSYIRAVGASMSFAVPLEYVSTYLVQDINSQLSPFDSSHFVINIQ